MFMWFPMKTENCQCQCWNIDVHDFVVVQKLKSRSMRNPAELTSCTVRSSQIQTLKSYKYVNKSIAFSRWQSQIAGWWCSQMQTSEIWQILSKNWTNLLHSLVSRVKVSNWWCLQMQNGEIWQILLKNWTNPMLLESRYEVAIRRCS